ALTLDIGGDRQATLHTPVAFEAAVAAAGGAADTHATVSWAFGNGAAGAGYAAEALYDYPGTYLVAAKATDGAAVAHAKVTVVVSSASVRIDALSPAGVLIKNEGAADLDLSGWVLVEGAGNFRIPEGTWVAPGVSALFAPRATKLALSDTAILAYPDGSIAAAYPAAGSGAAQPVALVAGSPRVQTVGYSATQDAASPAFTSPNADDHATAPPAGADPGGAALGASTSAAAASAPVSGAAGGLLHSRWTLGALVAVMIGGGAFLIL
ncbi:MAG: hypothetical protein KGI78_03195, partial [Patescibacteria group bacterium]|nr:hypothetical protein [Patescibacteria group bacterium]MDE2057836.1 hypothetical protein [Patescibacteria group bacterium]